MRVSSAVQWQAAGRSLAARVSSRSEKTTQQVRDHWDNPSQHCGSLQFGARRVYSTKSKRERELRDAFGSSSQRRLAKSGSVRRPRTQSTRAARPFSGIAVSDGPGPTRWALADRELIRNKLSPSRSMVPGPSFVLSGSGSTPVFTRVASSVLSNSLSEDVSVERAMGT